MVASILMHLISDYFDTRFDVAIGVNPSRHVGILLSIRRGIFLPISSFTLSFARQSTSISLSWSIYYQPPNAPQNLSFSPLVLFLQYTNSEQNISKAHHTILNSRISLSSERKRSSNLNICIALVDGQLHHLPTSCRMDG